VLAETGLEPEMLELEITESVAMENSEEVRGTLQELRDMGISIALDDFGTGYSSLHHLRELPIDKLKIDKSFLPISGKDVESTAIIDAILKLGEGLKMNVAVEGVEHDLQLNFLQQMGCREAQGYLFSVPVPRGKYETFVKELSREKLKNSI